MALRQNDFSPPLRTLRSPLSIGLLPVVLYFDEQKANFLQLKLAEQKKVTDDIIRQVGEPKRSSTP